MSNKINFQVIDATNWSKNFNSLEEIWDFFQSELSFWKEKKHSTLQGSDGLHLYVESAHKLQLIVRTLEPIRAKSAEITDTELQSKLNALKQTLTDLQRSWIWKGHPFTSQFLDIHTKYGKTSAANFIQFLISYEQYNQNALQEIGRIAAYEYISQDSEIPSRKEAEKASFDQLRADLERATANSIRENKRAIKQFREWKNGTSKRIRRLISRGIKIAQRGISTGKSQMQSVVDDICEQRDQAKARQTELELTYKNKLRLEKPAEYWKKAAVQHKEQAEKWTTWLVIASISGASLFTIFFIAFLTGIEIGVKLNTLQGIVLFGSILAGYAFLIRVLARLSFSSYHLMRDCEEREQLTYLYLALVKDGELSEESLGIVLQSLFSRSETGLLSSDSSPVMPLGGLTDVLRNSGRG